MRRDVSTSPGWHISVRAADVSTVDLVNGDLVLSADIKGTPLRLAIGGDLRITRDGESVSGRADDRRVIEAAQQLRGVQILEIKAEDEGALEVRCSNGTIVRVEPDSVIESWEFSLGDTIFANAVAGGGVAVWDNR